MKKLLYVFCILILAGCDEEAQPKEVPTVDSNFLDPADTAPFINPETSVALDSIVPTINPEDTNYNKR